MQTLTERRKAASLSKAALGRTVGCTGQMLSMIEAGKVQPGTTLAIRLGAALGIPAVELFPDLAGEINAVLAAVAASRQAASDS